MIRHDVSVSDNVKYIKKITPGQDIVMTGFIALEGTVRLVKEQWKLLSGTLPEEFLEAAEGLLEYLNRVPEAAVAGQHGATAMLTVRDGGIMTALWELAVCSGAGMQINLRSIPVKQETVEVCEALEVNPYYLLSGGCCLLTADNGFRLADTLRGLGFAAEVIGYITAGQDKEIINGDSRGFLNRPQTDEYIRFNQENKK